MTNSDAAARSGAFTTYFRRERDVGSDRTIRGRKRTKVVATVGPASESEDVLRRLFHEGMNIARINMGHGDYADHTKRIDMVRHLSEELERPIGILVDLQGPKIRTGRLAGNESVKWDPGAKVVITCSDCPGGTAEQVGTTYKDLYRDVSPGDVVLVDDGRLRLNVDRVEGRDIHLTVDIGGDLKSNKGINLPGVKVSAPALSERDKEDLAWALDIRTDFIALSFVREAADIRAVRRRIEEAGQRIPIIAKIEKPDAVENIHEIVREADGIMVARGDLGIEISTERLPVVQKHLISTANTYGKLVITATQMLESMMDNPFPTRAESSDVANAIFDGTDAVMLSGETAVGDYPVEAVGEMRRIAMEAETSPYFTAIKPDPTVGEFDRHTDAVTTATEILAERLDAKAILVFAHNPAKPQLISKHRPNQPVLVFCHDIETWRRHSLLWGVVPLIIPPSADPLDLVESGVREAERCSLLEKGDQVVVLLGYGRGRANTVRVLEV